MRPCASILNGTILCPRVTWKPGFDSNIGSIFAAAMEVMLGTGEGIIVTKLAARSP